MVYDFAGFFRPIDAAPTLNRVKAGSAIPLKFSLAGNQGFNIIAPGSPTSRPVACDSSTPSDPVEETSTAGGSSLAYDPLTDTYTYVWKSARAWAGTCRELTLALDDGTLHLALFRFTR